MALSPVAIKDTGTALDIILQALGLPTFCKDAFIGIALMREAKDTSTKAELKNLLAKIFNAIDDFIESEARNSEKKAIIGAVKKSLEQFKENAEKNNENINNIFTSYINNPNNLVERICKEHNSLGGNAEECYQRIINMIVTTLCDEKSVELFLNQNYALVQLLINNDNLSKELAEASGKIDELLKRNYLVESQLPPLSKRNPFKYSYEKIGFYGREDELKQIENFMLFDTQFTFWSITGKGGTGKSKLALHIAQEYIKRGWVVIWCESKTSYDNLLEKEFIHPTLFIFDYAGSRKEEIRTVIKATYRKDQNIRILFVERDKYTATSGMSVETWYSQIFNDKEMATYREDYEYSSASLNLGALDDEAIKSMLDDFAIARAKELSLDKNKFEEDEKDNIIRYVKETLPNKGANADFSDRCLFILFTADACLQEKSYLDWGAKELLDNYISQYSQKLPEADNLESHLNLLAIATATGGIDIEKDNTIKVLFEYIETFKYDFNYKQNTKDGRSFIKSLCEKDENNSIVTPMYPDLVGEYFFISRISNIEDDTAKDWIKEIFLNKKFRKYFTTFIVRGLMDWDTQDEWHSFVNWVINELNSNSDNKIYLADLYSELASGYGTKGNYTKQCEYREKELEIVEKVLPSNHPDLATTYNNLGVAYGDKGEYDNAIEYYEKALKIFEEVLPPHHPSLASSYNNLGVAYGNKGEYDNAIEYYEKALKIREEVLPPNHPDLAMSYNNLGVAYSNKGEYDKAIEYYEKALKIKEEVLPPNHPSLAMSYNNLGAAYSNKGEYDKAIDYHKKALKIREEVLPSNHPNLAGSYNNLGVAYVDKGDYDKAIEQYEKALAIFKTALPNHPNIIGMYINIIMLYKKLNDTKTAQKYIDELESLQKNDI
ncbi:MAG: tetratricopeptide repeat protein [Acutalibacteraceae bacterium]